MENKLDNKQKNTFRNLFTRITINKRGKIEKELSDKEIAEAKPRIKHRKSQIRELRDCI